MALAYGLTKTAFLTFPAGGQDGGTADGWVGVGGVGTKAHPSAWLWLRAWQVYAEKAAAVRAGATRFMVAGEESFGGS